ncbi:metal ABC transporter solute-binding protein, Zn/Mn family [Bifidobacterium thermophilum]|uniref:metal ABC transporter solute-binding protein, Zn/Mn family n=1 Tax=Bifidobacterium thermophilum TaxID=33905 RepID=UPI0030ADDBA2
MKAGKLVGRVIAGIAAIALAAPLSACGLPGHTATSPASPTSTAPAKGPIKVVASVNQWGTLAQQIGGDDVTITTIVSSTNVDAHDFEPKTSDIAAIQKAQVVVTNGAGYDTWAAKSIAKGAVSVSAAATVGAMNGDNPHLWFSKDARNAMATELADVFSKTLPAKRKNFDKRLKAWKRQESALEDDISAFAKKHKNTPYAATEAVAYYLMSDMQLKDLTPDGYTQSVTSGGEAAPADLQAFEKLLTTGGISLLVNNPQESSDSAAALTALASKNDIPVVKVTEQMPADQHTLTGWIGSLVSDMTKALDADGDAQDASASPSPSASASPSATPSSSAATSSPGTSD